MVTVNLTLFFSLKRSSQFRNFSTAIRSLVDVYKRQGKGGAQISVDKVQLYADVREDYIAVTATSGEAVLSTPPVPLW